MFQKSSSFRSVRSASEEHAIGNLSSKEYSVLNTVKKETIAWKLVMVVIAGLCGFSMCLLHVDQSAIWKLNNGSQRLYLGGQCPKTLTNSTQGIFWHYPQPRSYQRGECVCTPVHNFVILSMQRSGSGWFETLLNNHPSISSHGEVFSGRQRYRNLSTIFKTLDEVYNLDYLSSAVKVGCTSAVGFKWMLNQGVMEYNQEIVSYLEQKHVSVIFLLRWNILRRLVSVLANAYDREVKQVNGTHKSHVHSKQEADALAVYKPIINHKFLLANLRRILDVTKDALLLYNSTRHIIVNYEELVKDSKKLTEVQHFLGVPQRKLESQQVKIHTKPLSDQIQNWDLVYTTLQGTEFEYLMRQSDYR